MHTCICDDETLPRQKYYLLLNDHHDYDGENFTSLMNGNFNNMMQVYEGFRKVRHVKNVLIFPLLISSFFYLGNLMILLKK
jgi:hypothetical protein